MDVNIWHGELLSGANSAATRLSPIIPSEHRYLSIGRCTFRFRIVGERIAVALSDMPCAVDIERTDRDFSCTSRYLSPEEQAHPPIRDFRQLLGAPKLLYKYAGRRELDLLLLTCISTRFDGLASFNNFRFPFRQPVCNAFLAAAGRHSC